MLWSTHYLDFKFKDKSVPKSTWEIVYDCLMEMAIDYPDDKTEEDIKKELAEYYKIEVIRWDLKPTPQLDFSYFVLPEDDVWFCD